MKLPGLYLHIPFCKRKCNYCDFYFTTALSRVPSFVDALLEEIRLLAKTHPYGTFDTLYFGGGTPSILGAEVLEKLLSALRQHFRLCSDAEINLEVNPESATRDFLLAAKSLGITRVSAGVQTLDEVLLAWMNRGHTRQQALECLENIRATGFATWSLDLLHSIPGQSLADYEITLKSLLAFSPPHISVYSLTVEENTLLAYQIKNGKTTLPSEEESLSLMRTTHRSLDQAGYNHYELSNFAKDKSHRARHNRKYWHGHPYLGLGPSAHSFDLSRRWWNHASLERYNDCLLAGKLPIAEEEFLSPEKKFTEAVMLGLRRQEGIIFDEIKKGFQCDLTTAAAVVFDDLHARGLINLSAQAVSLTDEGYLLYNAIVRALLDAAENIGPALATDN